MAGTLALALTPGHRLGSGSCLRSNHAGARTVSDPHRQRVAAALRAAPDRPADRYHARRRLTWPRSAAPRASARQGAVRNLIESFNGMLARLEAESSTSIGRALQAQDAERQRIGRELHDEVGQSLTVVLLELKSAIDVAPPELGCRAGSPPAAATNPRRNCSGLCVINCSTSVVNCRTSERWEPG